MSYFRVSFTDVETPQRKHRTETSVIINKLSQLKEMTSSKLSDLLKKSPVRLFKDSTTESASFDIERNDFLTAQSIVGRRLSHAEVIQSEDSHVHHCADTANHEHLPSIPANCDIDSEHLGEHPNHPVDNNLVVPTLSDQLLCALEESSVDQIGVEKAPPLPPRNSVPKEICHSMHSLASTSGGTLERCSTSRQGYSSDNLADVEENDYVNIDFGDRLTIKSESPPSEGQEETIPATDHKTGTEFNQTLPELPPLPEFIIKQRLAKTMSVVDDTLTSLDELSKELKSDKAANRQSLPSELKLTKPASDFWVALEKYMETGQVDHVKDKSRERPGRRSEPIIKQSAVDTNPSQDRYLSFFITFSSQYSIHVKLLMSSEHFYYHIIRKTVFPSNKSVRL